MGILKYNNNIVNPTKIVKYKGDKKIYRVTMTEDDLEDLSGVGPATSDKLKDNGYDSYQEIAVADAAELSNKADIGESTANDIVQDARDKADIGGFETATSIMEERSTMHKISTGIPDVDDMLDGGIETQAITEFYGEYGSGKSQVTHQMAVNVQLPPEHGGASGSCIFVDSEDSFRPKRVAQMVRGLDPDAMEHMIEDRGFDFTVEDVKNSEVSVTDNPETPAEVLAQSFLDNVHVAKAFNSSHQILMLEKAREQAKQIENSGADPVKLVVVDSLTAHFRAEYVGRGALAERQQKLNKHLHDLIRLMNNHNAAAIITNQVQSNPNSYFGDPTDPIGGNILGHTSTFRIYLRQAKGDKRVVNLRNSPNLANGERTVLICDDGVKPENY